MRGEERTTTGVNPAAAALWASAFVLAALVIVQAGKLPGNPAYAEMGVGTGDFTLVTADSGRGGDAQPDELLYVLDSRAETLLVYEVANVQNGQIFLRGGAHLPTWFNNARR